MGPAALFTSICLLPELFSMSLFRKGLVAVIVNDERHVLICQRAVIPDAWQFPQGGIELNESPTQAFFRELVEELGNNSCEILRVGNRTTTYQWPSGIGDFLGQKQAWFLARFKENELPNLKNSDGTFLSWKWESPQRAIDMMVDWKRSAFEQGMKILGLL
jgi:putative (di)nucleoside polyphosphate hydrolase